ncbi:hypothetical protein BKH46_03705 [Helicobacter sp. 12S02634-8]|uniref:hypothetical protein n=1 Tax=Helicobacter sp. 12S02634-8 TaxID=1476199 RepID=UPI000BA6DC1A|nr:hypothetical protein [Helicobacter sp. 12S02634-8]PAF47542.1 hypothetical protein BKH46_03705 [Helicobacter sp. 12S02634-8]
MKILLLNNDSMVTKLFEAVANKLGIELLIDLGFEPSHLEEEMFLFVDEGINAELPDSFWAHHFISKAYLHKHTSPKIQGFDFYIKKPFLPTEILDIINPKLRELGVTDIAASEVTKANLPPQTGEHLEGLDLDDFDLEGLESLSMDTQPQDFSELSDFSIEDLSDYNADQIPLPPSSLEDMQKPQEGAGKAAADDPFGLQAQDTEAITFDLDHLDNPDHSLSTPPQELEGLQENQDQELENQGQEQNQEIEELEAPQDTQGTEEVKDTQAAQATQDIETAQIEAAQDIQEEDQLLATAPSPALLAPTQAPTPPQDQEELVSLAPKEQDSDISGILDKNQIDEVKKILNETSSKDIDMQAAENTQEFDSQEFDDIDTIDEQDIINALSDGINSTNQKSGDTRGIIRDIEEQKDPQNTQESYQEISQDLPPQAPSFSKLTKKSSKTLSASKVSKGSKASKSSAPKKKKPQQSPATLGNAIANMLQNNSLESLQSLLDGMELTINIRFPDKKK